MVGDFLKDCHVANDPLDQSKGQKQEIQDVDSFSRANRLAMKKSALIAGSLSRSGKRILHLDPNEYYGGAEAALSLAEAESWASRCAEATDTAVFSHASITKPPPSGEKKLLSSRAYSLALAPHLIYAKSNTVPALVSSQCHNQLDFQAVGSWFVLDSASNAQSGLIRVPSSREDVFQDTALSLKAKRGLMKFLRFVANFEEQTETWHDSKDTPFPAFLEQKFALPAASHGPILALTMSTAPSSTTSTGYALPRIAQHLRSIGIFGPGFGAVLPKWGGLAEIAQVACRAGAVGGGVYVLNKAIKEATKSEEDNRITLKLSDAEQVSTTWLCGSAETMQTISPAPDASSGSSATVSRSISVISSPLSALFPSTSEGGVTPAGAVVVVPSSNNDGPPVHILVHTSEAGECPMNQCVAYASVALSSDVGYAQIDQAIANMLSNFDQEPTPEVLWRLQYQQRIPAATDGAVLMDGSFISLPAMAGDLVLADSVLNGVQQAWQSITNEDENMFMKFTSRSEMEDEE
ncbi:Rab proteins geranylgeranyltransferase component A [Saxophila tyrrhenica]|uniref:Rab proteins geranylgeranyltransferase n=1 Tax=Saxophila tyrrhenica TaxID=1690608 RepID=A0AAV9PNR9_9PEZI|nr:Rab proteins geranylgeranyltransferase component A [Saxophila tyrrhenica]